MHAEVPFPAHPCPIRLGLPDLRVPRTPRPLRVFGFWLRKSSCRVLEEGAWESLAGVTPATSDPSPHGSCEGHRVSPGAAVLTPQT